MREDRIIIFSSHQMSYVESFCDDIAIINNGRIVLEGNLQEIKEEMSEGRLRIRFSQEAMLNLDFLASYRYIVEGADVILTLLPGQTKKEFIKYLFSEDIEITMFMDYFPSLREIFIEKAGDQDETI